MKLQITASKETNRVQIAGDLDLYHVADAREALLDLITTKPETALELAGVETCDAAGVQLLLAARRTAVAHGKSFVVLTPAPVIEKYCALLGLGLESLQPRSPLIS